jgi:hypothetical protein
MWMKQGWALEENLERQISKTIPWVTWERVVNYFACNLQSRVLPPFNWHDWVCLLIT